MFLSERRFLSRVKATVFLRELKVTKLAVVVSLLHYTLLLLKGRIPA